MGEKLLKLTMKKLSHCVTDGISNPMASSKLPENLSKTPEKDQTQWEKRSTIWQHFWQDHLYVNYSWWLRRQPDECSLLISNCCLKTPNFIWKRKNQHRKTKKSTLLTCCSALSINDRQCIILVLKASNYSKQNSSWHQCFKTNYYHQYVTKLSLPQREKRKI